MRILITTGLSSGSIGGPAQYGPRLKNEFERLGHNVKLAQYGSVESAMLKIWPSVYWADYILALDTFSVGVPSVLAAKLFGRKVIVRVGGDFLWSAYVNRTNEPITLPDFYENMPKLNVKERLIFSFTKKMVAGADFLAFNTEWQREIWQKRYDISYLKSGVVRNYIPEKREGEISTTKNFLWAGRVIPEKNPKMLEKFGVDVTTGKSHEEVLEKIRNSYVVVSLAFPDICPNFVIEGISFCKPFIMTRETGLNELMSKGGIFVNPCDEEEISRAFKAMLDEDTYNKYLEELNSLNLSHNWAKMAEEYLEIWKEI